MPDWDFDGVRQAARRAWTEALAAVEIEAPPELTRSFYTALYHAYQAPSLFMDRDGRYRGPDNAVHQAQGFTNYSTFSLWDTYRALHPLLTILQPPQRTDDIVRSLLAAQHASPYGMLPVWAFQGQETWCMIGYHAVAVIADAYMKGIRGYDAEEALAAMVATASYGPYGGLAATCSSATCRSTRRARRPPRRSSTPTTTGPSRAWRKGSARASSPRSSTGAPATGATPSIPTPASCARASATARSASPSTRRPAATAPTTPRATPGSTRGTCRRTSPASRRPTAGPTGCWHAWTRCSMPRSIRKVFAHMEDITGLIGWYAHGNEPSHHVAYLYAAAGQPWRTQARLQQIMDTQYAPRPDGLAGNDDLGQMSAWYVFTALGFYPVAPASNEYIIGRPFLKRAVLHLPNGRTFTVRAPAVDDAHPYVAALTLNGKPLRRVFLRHEEIMAGGELRFTMSDRPNHAWPGAGAEQPYSMSARP